MPQENKTNLERKGTAMYTMCKWCGRQAASLMMLSRSRIGWGGGLHTKQEKIIKYLTCCSNNWCFLCHARNVAVLRKNKRIKLDHGIKCQSMTLLTFDLCAHF